MTDFPLTTAFTTPNYTTQSGTAYPLRIDAALAALAVVAAAFQPVLAGGWSVTIGAATIPSGDSVVTVAAQTVTVSGAPASGARIDRIVIDRQTGAASVVEGTAADSPVAPSIPSGKLPCARLTIPAGTAALSNAMGVDERMVGGSGGIPASADPLMDGTAAVGDSYRYAREDHVHPLDTSRAPLSSPQFTGTPTALTPPTGDRSGRLATTAFVGDELVAYNPAALSTAGGGAPSYSLRAWARWDASSGTPTIAASGNVSSITDLGTGYGRVNYAVPMPDANGGGLMLGAYNDAVNTLMGGKVFNYTAASADFRTYVAGSSNYYDLPLNAFMLVR